MIRTGKQHCLILLTASVSLVFPKLTLSQQTEGHGTAPKPSQVNAQFEQGRDQTHVLSNSVAFASLPDAPGVAGQSAAQDSARTSGRGRDVQESDSELIELLPPVLTRKPLTAEEKLHIYIHQTFGPQAVIIPAFAAGFSMLNPPDRYPREWKDGGGAFGRWYGDRIVTSTTKRTSQFLAEAALHEDPRYVPSSSKNALLRTVHALAFTLVDKTDSGRNTLAVSNFASAAAGGFVGMSYLPDGYNDVTHAGQRSLRNLQGIAIGNIAAEFRPEWGPLVRKIHLPRVLPAWWTPEHPKQP